MLFIRKVTSKKEFLRKGVHRSSVVRQSCFGRINGKLYPTHTQNKDIVTFPQSSLSANSILFPELNKNEIQVCLNIFEAALRRYVRLA